MIWHCELSELINFTMTAKPNEIFVYYKGPKLTDTMLGEAIGKKAYEFATKGLIYLVQKRLAGNKYDFNYYAIKASPTPVFSLIPLPVSETEGARHGQIQRIS